METSRKIFLRSAGIGFGIVSAVVIFYLALDYYNSRQKPWDRNLFNATFAGISVETGDKISARYAYTLENLGDKDYYLPKDPESAYIVQAEGKGYSHVQGMQWDKGIYIPSKKKVVVSFLVPYDYSDYYSKKTLENMDKLDEFFQKRLKELDGFVILDKENRYEIVFPNGWKEWKKKRIVPSN